MKKVQAFDIAMFSILTLVIVLGIVAISNKTEHVEPIESDTIILNYSASVETTNLEVVKEASETIPTKKYYDVPLSNDVQDVIIDSCNYYHISPALVLAMIERESNYLVDAVGDYGNSIGLMQINLRWQKDRCEQLGVYNLTDPRQNVAVGLDILNELFEQSEDLAWVLMAYNGGTEYADNKIQNGIYETEYTRYILSRSAELEESMR